MRNLWFTQFFGQNHDTILPQRYSTYETTYYESYEAEEGDCDEDAGREAKRQKNLCGGRGWDLDDQSNLVSDVSSGSYGKEM